MHGQYTRYINMRLISEEDTFLWLSMGDTKAETENEIKLHKIRYYKQHIVR